MHKWTNDERIMIACCNDGTRPVIFKIERIDIPETDEEKQWLDMKPAAAGTVIPIAADILFFIIFLHPAPSLPFSSLLPAQTPLCCSLRE